MSEFASIPPKKSGRDTLLDDLIDETEKFLQLQISQSGDIRMAYDDVRSSIVKHFSLFPCPRYAATLSPQGVVCHMKLLSKINLVEQKYVVSCEQISSVADDESGVVVKITIICEDVPKIFNRINTVLEQLTLSTIEASVLSTTTKLAFDEFISKVDGSYADKCDMLEADILHLLLTKSLNTFSGIENIDNNVEDSAWNRQAEKPRVDSLETFDQSIETSFEYVHLSSSDIQIVRKIGSGQVCETYEAVLLGSGLAVVLKKPLTAPCVSEAEREKYRQLWQQELSLMRLIGHHPNICRFVGLSPPNESFESMCLCYEFLSGGCLSDIIQDASRPLQPLKVAAEVAHGMRHLHRLQVMHRDLKPANVILDSTGCAKIADFGLSCRIKSGSEMTAETGTYRWMAPEVIRHEHYSLAADVYSFGIVLWELYSRTRPFDDLTPFQAAYQVAVDHRRPSPLPNMPASLLTLLQKLWHRNAASRPTFDDICVIIDDLLIRQDELLF